MKGVSVPFDVQYVLDNAFYNVITTTIVLRYDAIAYDNNKVLFQVY